MREEDRLLPVEQHDTGMAGYGDVTIAFTVEKGSHCLYMWICMCPWRILQKQADKFSF